MANPVHREYTYIVAEQKELNMPPASNGPPTPKVFISSTAEDLGDYRAAARDAALRAGCTPDMQEYWVAKDNPPLAECLERVANTDVLIIIAAHRYGWAPPNQDGDEDKSITWLECEQAVEREAEVLAFVLDDGVKDWPDEYREDYNLRKAMEAGNGDVKLYQDTQRRIGRLKDFKDWLNGRAIRETFVSPEDLRGKAALALKEWLARWARKKGIEIEPAAPEVPPDYLIWLRGECESVELLGLELKEAHTTGLSQVYVPAVTETREAGLEDRELRPGQGSEEKARPDLLLARLDRESLYVPGAPGAGKSTFCRWLAWLASARGLPDHPIPAPKEYREIFPGSVSGRLPLLVTLREFWSAMPCRPGARAWTRAELEAALVAWLDGRLPGGLDGAALLVHLHAGSALLILDGVDEVPENHGEGRKATFPRAALISGLADALPAWGEAGNRVLLTSRPYGLGGAEVRRLGLPLARLASLPSELQELFIRRWFAAVDPDHREEKAGGLTAHLAARGELAVLTDNPMLLTALCVKYGEGQRLPEDLYHLYDGIVNSVLYNRYPGDEKERAPVRNRLAAVARGMHTGMAMGEARIGPAAEVGVAEIERILQEFAEANPATERGLNDSAAKREDLLSHSGLLLPRGEGRAGFYHLSFQEFLAADYLARSGKDKALMGIFRERGATPEWRPTLVFLFAALAFRHRSAQWVVDRLTELADELEPRRVKKEPARAVLAADCLEIALAKGWYLGRLGPGFIQVCLNAIEDEVELVDRNRLGLILGRLGDPRILDPKDRNGYVEIPPGRYPYQEKGVFEVRKPYWLARYPVTNGQYRRFLREGGYENEMLWSSEGWKWRREKEISEPDYWKDRRFNGPNQPVVGVSWWEAEAFCRWAGGRLPTEKEWEAAARGPRGHEFPWGGPWRDGICNTREAALGVTSPVGLFPASRQADFGLEDLSGNVWEWCAEKAYGSSRRLRGGSWFDGLWGARAADRIDGDPVSRDGSGGFRVLLSDLRQD